MLSLAGPTTNTVDEGNREETKYSVIAASAGVVVLSLAVTIAVVCWRQTAHKREFRERIQLNQLIAMRTASRQGLSQAPRLPTVWEEDEEPTAIQRSEESEDKPVPLIKVQSVPLCLYLTL